MTERIEYADLREWLKIVADCGELVQVDGAHWDLEIGALTDMIRRQSRVPPAILFDHVEGYPAGYRVLTGMLNTIRRLALTTGLPLDLDERQYVDAWRRRLRRLDGELQPPAVVRDGPVLEHVYEGDAIDLWRFPSPRWHEHDGGRFIGAATLAFTRDPDTGSVNMTACPSWSTPAPSRAARSRCWRALTRACRSPPTPRSPSRARSCPTRSCRRGRSPSSWATTPVARGPSTSCA
jgi:hypothetical protein